VVGGVERGGDGGGGGGVTLWGGGLEKGGSREVPLHEPLAGSSVSGGLVDVVAGGQEGLKRGGKGEGGKGGEAGECGDGEAVVLLAQGWLWKQDSDWTRRLRTADTFLFLMPYTLRGCC
jgi:hypothetical protein